MDRRKKVLCIFGTRPEAIKMAPVVKELQRHPDECVVTVCVTAQHREMLDQVLPIFRLKPDIDLNLMQENQTLDVLTARSIKLLSTVITEFCPNIILVQGDTTTAMAGALAGFYKKVPLGHLEAGLRTYNMYNPFPEEINRKIITVLSSYNFAPTKKAKEALLKEGIAKERIFLTGNTIVDALKAILKKKRIWGQNFLQNSKAKKIILVTAHRRENFGKPLKNICEALKKVARRNPGIEIVYPVHLNPNVKSVVYSRLSNLEGIRLLSPLDYCDFIWLLSCSYLALTDSGGVQEEAPVLGKPVLVLRNETERPEGVEANVAKLVGTDPDAIITNIELLLNDPRQYKKMSRATSLYGDGFAAKKIANIILG